MSVRLQAWLIIGGLVAAVFLSNPYAFIPDTRREGLTDPPRPDFLAFYSAGTLIRQDPGQLYNEDRQADIQASALGLKVETSDRGFMPFVYPAIMALPFLPLALLSYSAAYVVMLALNVVLCGLALDLLSRRFQMSRGAGKVLVLCAALSIPVILTLANGQISFLVFIIFIMLIGDIREGRARAGVWTGLLAFKPTLIPALLLWFIFRREWRSVAYAAAIGSALLLISLLLVGPHAVRDYYAMSVKMATEQYFTVNSVRMPNLRALSQFIGYGESVGIVLSLLVLGLLLVKGRKVTDSSCAALILAAVLVARHIHFQDLNLLLIILAMMLNKMRLTVVWRWSLIVGTILTTAAITNLASHQLNQPILPACLLALFLVFVFQKSVEAPKPATG